MDVPNQRNGCSTKQANHPPRARGLGPIASSLRSGISIPRQRGLSVCHLHKLAVAFCQTGEEHALTRPAGEGIQETQANALEEIKLTFISCCLLPDGGHGCGRGGYGKMDPAQGFYSRLRFSKIGRKPAFLLHADNFKYRPKFLNLFEFHCLTNVK